MYFKCSSCDGNIITRVQISHGLRQEIHFNCPHCETESKLVLLLDEPPEVKISYAELENLEKIEDIENLSNQKIITLSSDFTIPDNCQNKELYFPFAYRMREILSDAFGINYSGSNFIGVGGLANVEELWKNLYKAYHFNKKGNKILRNNIISDDDLSDVCFSFIKNFLGPDSFDKKIQEIIIFARKCLKSNKDEFNRFTNDLIIVGLEDRIESYIEILDSFFSNYQDFKQMILQARLDVSTHKNDKASSVNFKRTKMLYGEAFEVLGSNINIISALNNIYNNRNYDEFESTKLDFKKYSNSDKGGKMRCFEKNEKIYNIFGKEYDNQLRNATHHKWLKFNNENQKITYPTSGNGSNIINISYAEYLLKSNNIIITIMYLFAFDLILLNNLGLKINKD